MFSLLATTVLFSLSLSSPSAPTKFDWRQHGAVGPVKNQGMLGNPRWFAEVASVESLHTIQTYKLISLSMAEMQDCCNRTQDGFNCIKDLHGLCSEADYPTVTGKCHNATCRPAASINGYKSITVGDEDALEAGVLQNPVAADINASLQSFQTYRSGIYDDPQCTNQTLDHAVLIVGYSTLKGQGYWICQNSWGSAWGMEGYILIARGSNRCGIASAAAYPV